MTESTDQEIRLFEEVERLTAELEQLATESVRELHHEQVRRLRLEAELRQANRKNLVWAKRWEAGRSLPVETATHRGNRDKLNQLRDQLAGRFLVRVVRDEG